MNPYRESSEIRRTYWTIKKVQRGYNSPREERKKVSERKGELVASLTERGLHAPALDIDFPVALERLDERLSRLILTGITNDEKWGVLLHSLRSAELMTEEDFQRALFDCLWGLPLRRMPPLILCVPVRVVDSTTTGHYHVYLEKEMRWKKYAELLNALAIANCIELDYLTSSLKRKMTMLYKPGVKNPKKHSSLSHWPGLNAY